MTPAVKTVLGERLQRLAAASAEDQERRAPAVLGVREGFVPCPCSTRARRRR
jgi:sulfite exporter TauE/SafE